MTKMTTMVTMTVIRVQLWLDPVDLGPAISMAGRQRSRTACRHPHPLALLEIWRFQNVCAVVGVVHACVNPVVELMLDLCGDLFTAGCRAKPVDRDIKRISVRLGTFNCENLVVS